MYQNTFYRLLNESVTDTSIRFLVDGTEATVGARSISRADETPPVTVRVLRDRFFGRVLTYGNLGMGESYIDQDFQMAEGTLDEFLTILLRNRLPERMRQHPRLAIRVLGIRILNRLRGKWRNVQRHYDLGDDLFEAFLDPTMTYSCGYARTPGDTLEELQLNKLDRICHKLRLAPGDRLLDIGCGYAGLLIHAAKHYGVTGTGVTISKRHCARARVNIEKEGLSDQLRIELADFASVTGRYDKVVSVGMLEHVAPREHKAYFKTIANALTPSGLGLVHAIGCNAAKNEHDPFIQKYIFPGSGQPRLSEIAGQLERHGLAILDVENIVRHYALTVQHWLQRFQANRKLLDHGTYDEAFVRTWEYYLYCGVAAARASDGALYQVLFTRDYTAPIPLQRV